MLGSTSPSSPGDDLLTVTVIKDEQGYGMKVSGDNPVYVQSVKEAGAAWRAGLRAGDRILRVDGVPVHAHTHQQVVHMIRANPSTVLTVHQNSQRLKTPITAPVPVNPEKQRQVEFTKVNTFKLMLDNEQKYIRELKNELTKVPDVRKQAQLESAEQRCIKLQHEIDALNAVKTSNMETDSRPVAPHTPRLTSRLKPNPDKGNQVSPPANSTNFLSSIPRSLSNLTGQSLRNLRQGRQNSSKSQDSQPQLVRQNSDETNNKRRHVHNNTVPIVPVTCLDNITPPPLPPRSAERPKPLNPMAKPVRYSPNTNFKSPVHKYQYPMSPMHQSMPSPQQRDEHTQGYNSKNFRRSLHSLDSEVDGPQPNSIAMQMVYPLVNVPPPSVQTDNRSPVPVIHMRSQSSPEHLEHGGQRSSDKEWWETGTPPPGTPPPPYHHNTQPCADPQRAIISMEEDDSPASDNSTYSGLFSNLRSVRESKARMAVLLNWLLAEKRCACANLLLLITDGYRSASGVTLPTLRRWAYEIHSTFLMPNAVMALNGVDENMANEIEHVLENEHDKEELLRNVFRKARQKAKDELTQQLTEFQVKRQVGLGMLYGPEDSILEKCEVDKQQELVVVERIMCQRVEWACGGAVSCGGQPAQQSLQAALVAAAHTLHCRAATIAAAAGGARCSFLQRDKLYKQRLKHLAKQHPQPFVVRGHHLTLQALTSAAHCHHCDLIIWGLSPQAYICTDCNLRVHRTCARGVEEACCIDGEHHNNRISRFIDRIHNSSNAGQDSSDKKSRKSSGTTHFLNMERSFRKAEDEQPWENTVLVSTVQERRDESDESLYESADCQSDAISASDDALPHLRKSPTISKESLKLVLTDEELEMLRPNKRGHRKAMSLSNPLEIVKNLSDDWIDTSKKAFDKNSDKKVSKESLWSEEDKDFVYDGSIHEDVTKNCKKEEKTSRKSSAAEIPKPKKSNKSSSVSALNFLRRKKTQAVTALHVKPVAEVADVIIDTDEILKRTKFFLEEEKRHTSLCDSKVQSDTDSDEGTQVTPKSVVINGDNRRRLSRQTSKSKIRGKSQTVKVNTLRKSHSGTLKKSKKKGARTPTVVRSRQASFAEPSGPKKKNSEAFKHNSWLFNSIKGEPKREGSSEDQVPAEQEVDSHDNREHLDKETRCRQVSRGVNRAESCRERDAPHTRRGKQRNASDPNRLTAPNNNHDLEPNAVTAPSGSSSSSSLSSRSNESNTVPAEQQASQSEWSEDEDQLCSVWSESLPPNVLDTLTLPPRLRKRQEVIHELIVSEGSHVRWLKVLSNVFLRPLEKGEHSHLLTSDELRALFPNLPAVRERHGKLYAELKTLRSQNHIVHIRPLADAMLNTLGESLYASCLSRFCSGQRMALESLRERRRKSKELQQFLYSREQLAVCGRLQLRDLLACVWQRLTKYQLLLENILKTVADEDSETEEDVARLKQALDVAKEVLHGVDTAIRTAENQHRLRTIQSKLEVRCGGGELEELRKLDLTQHCLKLEGELTLRSDSKKITVLALMMSEWLVLLHREGDRYILKPISTPTVVSLSPLIKWSTVLFRANAAVKNTFFLMNINGVQMHELSANTAAEYATWMRYIQQAPLAEARATTRTPAPQQRQTEDSGTSVSRNPSDASEKSSTTQEDAAELPAASLERDSPAPARSEDRTSLEKEPQEEKEKEPRKPCQPTVGRISIHGPELREPLENSSAVVINPPVAENLAHVAATAFASQEQLRRLDETISRAMKEKSAIVASLLGVPEESYQQVAELAVAETLGQVDVRSELRGVRLERSRSSEGEETGWEEGDMHQLLLAAQQQANQLTEILTRALSVTEASVVARHRTRRSLCDSCTSRVTRTQCNTDEQATSIDQSLDRPVTEAAVDSVPVKATATSAIASGEGLSRDTCVTWPEWAGRGSGGDADSVDDIVEGSAGSALLATRLVGIACGLQGALAGLLGALPTETARRRAQRAEGVVRREEHDARSALSMIHDYEVVDDITQPDDNVNQNIQDQLSNGG